LAAQVERDIKKAERRREDTMTEELFVRCECGNEGVNLVQDDETGEVYLAVWYYSRTDMSIAHKLRWVWKIIQGKPYVDEIIVGVGWLPLIVDKLSAMIVVAEQKNRTKIVPSLGEKITRCTDGIIAKKL
jgi:hypothetical protein